MTPVPPNAPLRTQGGENEGPDGPLGGSAEGSSH
jgi:hypothetical protein